MDQTVQEAISVAVGPSGNVYVLSYNDKIIVFDADGRFIRNFPRMVWTTAYDLAVDRATGQMWVVDPVTNLVVHLTAVGNPSESWAVGAGSRGIEFARGEVFVSDAAGNRVQVYTPTGTLLRSITTTPALQQPRGLAVGASGNLYVSSFTDNTVRILGPTGTLIRSVTTIGNPSDVAVDECRGVFYVLGEASDLWAAHRISDGARLYTQSTATGTSHAGLSLSDDGSRLYVALNHNAGRGVNLYLR
jgi:DNA-binding beta-propeller fold protein YncE